MKEKGKLFFTVNKCRRNDGIEKNHYVASTLIILSGKNHQCTVKIVDGSMRNRLFT